MTIKESGIRPITVNELLEERLHIPPYQRPYSWRPETALQMLDDLREACGQSNDVPYVLGAVILHRDKEDVLNVVDGQQRLLTLRILLNLLDNPRAYVNIIIENSKGAPLIVRVITALRREIGSSQRVLADSGGQNSAERTSARTDHLARFIRDRCQLIRIETDDIDEAFRIFDSQNYRGKPLAPHDLLKAYHLRVMRDDAPAMKAALVADWEAAGDEALGRLFSIYLYRIARWLRGESAPQFTAQDIELFKGIDPSRGHTPYARYHGTAQLAAGMLSESMKPCQGQTDAPTSARTAMHARFPLDAPWLAGRSFFERIAFLLDELNCLAQEAFEGDYKKFTFYDWETAAKEESNLKPAHGRCPELKESPANRRYRYVCELYLAAALYYTNKFGVEAFREARDRLFAWAYAARWNLLRVQYRSIDNLARGKDAPEESLFARIRNAEDAGALRGLADQLPPRTATKDGHENELTDLLKKKGFEIYDA
ncbi:DUF262 domain-containing protein [Acidithiobacillus caldus]|uniref:Uncharacterized protein n=1 Tax=Acidithiobacillus caldus TaxID=33059 RepID=A0A1E7YP66_9PROT|nr:DUF262 domain-containing protein [Acidithiobacillus caldus]OFC36815.1 hypothetical protein BAE27_05245 [Acidithiobacillus caldus]OFC38886.1 hypothetical protein BAE28_04715 [Acidithiobacillus caldus]OFC40053.1 hypothetical protein BAE29_05950 [Acidithiobacillus caldus]